MAKCGPYVHERRHESSRSGNEHSGAFWCVRRVANRQSPTLSVTIRHLECDIMLHARRSGSPIHCFGADTTYVRGQPN